MGIFCRQLLIEFGDLFGRVILHAPETGVVARDPAVNKHHVVGLHGTEGKLARRSGRSEKR